MRFILPKEYIVMTLRTYKYKPFAACKQQRAFCCQGVRKNEVFDPRTASVENRADLFNCEIFDEDLPETEGII